MKFICVCFCLFYTSSSKILLKSCWRQVQENDTFVMFLRHKWFLLLLSSVILRCIHNPVKHLIWSFFQKYLTVECNSGHIYISQFDIFHLQKRKVDPTESQTKTMWHSWIMRWWKMGIWHKSKTAIAGIQWKDKKDKVANLI